MNYRPLGHTGLRVSELGFGCASYWGKPVFPEADAISLVHVAAERGITFFDTGSSYSEGNAEPRLGRAIQCLRNKHDLVIATKVGTRLGRFNRPFKDFRPSSVRLSIEDSLRKLRLDTIPLLQLHGPQSKDFSEELLSEMGKIKAEGKVKHFGVNSFDMKVIGQVMELPIFEVVMIDYNILRAYRQSVINQLAARKIGVLAGMALAGGLYANRNRLTGLRDIWYILRAHRNHRGDMRYARQNFDFLKHQPDWTGGQIALN